MRSGNSPQRTRGWEAGPDDGACGGTDAGTLGREVISTRQRKIAELAQREPTLTTLAHHVDDVWMRELPANTQGRGGRSDGRSTRPLEGCRGCSNFKSGRYRYAGCMEKPGTSKTRPIGIPTLEDPATRGADGVGAGVRAGLSRCSSFRPGRGAHQACVTVRCSEVAG